MTPRGAQLLLEIASRDVGPEEPESAGALRKTILACIHTDPTSVHATDSNGWNALHWAAYHDNTPLLSLLVATGADLHARTAASTSKPLHLAAGAGNLEAVDTLLRMGASPVLICFPCKSREGFAAFDEQWAAEAMGYTGGTTLFGRDTYRGCYAVELATIQGHTDVLRRLMVAVKPLGEMDWRMQGAAAMSRAIILDDAGMVDALIEEGVHPDIVVSAFDQYRALHLASMKGSLGAARVLLARGADPMARTAYGDTPASMALWTGFDQREMIAMIMRAWKEG